jgi:hypothetical protein
MRQAVLMAATFVGVMAFSSGNSTAADSTPGAPPSDSPQATLEVVKNLLKKDPKNPALLKQASELAIKLEDYPDAARFVQQRLAQNPNEFGLRALLPVLYLMQHDQPDFERERTQLVKTWKDSNDPAIKAKKWFLLEGFKVDDYTVQARQCYEIGGRFGVKYLFLYAKNNSPVSKITLEVNYLEGQIAAEIKKTHDIYPSISMDAYSGDTHRTIMLTSPGPNNKEPDYNTVRERVVAYLKSPGAAISSQSMPGKQFAVDCDFPPTTPEQQQVIDAHKM